MSTSFKLSHRRLFQAIACTLLMTIFSYALLPSMALASAPTRVEAIQGDEVTVPDGTEIQVVTTEEISSKTAAENDPIDFKVDEDVKINNRVVISKGTIVKGIVSESEKSGRMGKSGKLNIRIESTTAVDGQKIKLRAAKSGKGGDKTGTVIALSLLVSPLFLLKKGKDAKVKAGTKIKVFTDEEKKVKVSMG
jgi:hypothetical protein